MGRKNKKANAPKFKRGDVVRLNSGGPPMTIADIDEVADTEPGDINYWCSWFDNSNTMMRTEEILGCMLTPVLSENSSVDDDDLNLAWKDEVKRHEKERRK